MAKRTLRFRFFGMCAFQHKDDGTVDVLLFDTTHGEHRHGDPRHTHVPVLILPIAGMLESSFDPGNVGRPAGRPYNTSPWRRLEIRLDDKIPTGAVEFSSGGGWDDYERAVADPRLFGSGRVPTFSEEQVLLRMTLAGGKLSSLPPTHPLGEVTWRWEDDEGDKSGQFTDAVQFEIAHEAQRIRVGLKGGDSVFPDPVWILDGNTPEVDVVLVHEPWYLVAGDARRQQLDHLVNLAASLYGGSRVRTIPSAPDILCPPEVYCPGFKLPRF